MSNDAVRPRGGVTYDNRGRVVVVTGGCGGIGQAIVEAFVQSGATVVALDLRDDLADQLPAGTVLRRADVSQAAECESAARWTMEQYGGVDVLVNTAAIQPPASYLPLHRLPDELWQRMVDVNLSSYAYMAKAVLPAMLSQKCGVIINLASAQGHRTARQVPAYGPLKAANIMQAMQWGVEYARHGVRVVSISPGAIDTPLLRASLEAQGGGGELANRHPLGRLGLPLEVARAVLWLASSEASFVTATDLAVDGGLGAFAAFADPYTLQLDQGQPPRE